MAAERSCFECDRLEIPPVSRREFVRVLGGSAAAAVVASTAGGPAFADDTPAKPQPETLVKKLYDTLTPKQKDVVAFAWDYADDRGVLRAHVSNNWHITKPIIAGDFFTKDQQEIIEAIFYGLYHPDWHDRLKKQLADDAGGYGKAQNIAIFGEPGTGKFEFVMTGRHLTIRCDGDSTEHTAFGGPIFYGHAAQGFNEKPDHPGNVYWHQALKANSLFQMLDGKQRATALVPKLPQERNVHFTGKEGKRTGLPVTEMTRDQKQVVADVLSALLEPYRLSDRAEVRKCLEKQGGLDACQLSFYQEGDLGNDKVWDNWRLEGPSFVWYFRGTPHVHVWVNIADDSSVKITTAG